MAETLYLSATDKAGRYAELLPQIEALLQAETDLVANLANVAAVLKEAFGFFWVGFYEVKAGILLLGPFPETDRHPLNKCALHQVLIRVFSCENSCYS
jgi:GAF domain-containing protein